jgi:hypothetical protein
MGTVWVRATRTSDGRPVVNLLDLRTQPDDRWDTGKTVSPEVTGWRLGADLREPVAASPWTMASDAAALRMEAADGWRLPRFRRWLMVTGAAEG